MRKLHQKLIQLLLPIRQLAAAAVVHPEAIHDAIDDQETVLAARKLPTQRVQQLQLMFAVERAGIGDILLRRVWIHAEPFRDLGDALRSECALCVNVGDLAPGAAHFLRELCDDGHGMRQLGLAAAELAEDFADAHALKASGCCKKSSQEGLGPGDLPSKDCVELLASGGDANDSLPLMAELHCCDEARGRGLVYDTG
ncbi:hypothetical protein BJX96DRAFT_52298 [Aspergillus floccosus]